MSHDRPNVIDEYIKVSKELALLEKKKTTLRKEVLPIIQEYGDWDDCSLTETNRISYNEDLVLDWIKKAYPEVYGDVTRIALDMEKLQTAISLRLVDMQQMPPECEIKQIVYNINVNRRTK